MSNRNGIATTLVRDLVATGHQPTIPEPRNGESRNTTPVASRAQAEQDRRTRREHRDRKIERRELRDYLSDQLLGVNIPVERLLII